MFVLLFQLGGNYSSLRDVCGQKEIRPSTGIAIHESSSDISARCIALESPQQSIARAKKQQDDLECEGLLDDFHRSF